MHAPREVMGSLRASPLFAFFVLVTLAIAGVVALMTLVMTIRPGFMGMTHFADPHHRTHDLTYGFLYTTIVVGILAQLRRPSNNVAGMVMALIPGAGLLLAAALSTDAAVILSVERVSVIAMAVFAALLHPTGPAFFRSFRASRVNWVMLALVVVAAVPLLELASTTIRLQATLLDEHAAMGHYGFMAAFSFTVIAVGVLASLRPVGWRLPAWVAGLLPCLLGVTSLLYPDSSSSLGLIWALAAISWGAVFVVASELTRDMDVRALPGPRGVTTQSDR